MEEALEDAKEEIKRADHLLYVSLKYTRTVDVIRSLIERLISTFDFAILSLLKYAKEKNKIKEIPNTPFTRCEVLKNIFTELKLEDFLDLYLLLRKIMRGEYTRREEYRRHVTMISEVENKKIEINIDILHEYYNKTKKFLKTVEKVIKNA